MPCALRAYQVLKGTISSSYNSTLGTGDLGEGLTLEPNFLSHFGLTSRVSSPSSPLGQEVGGFECVGPSLPIALVHCGLRVPLFWARLFLLRFLALVDPILFLRARPRPPPLSPCWLVKVRWSRSFFQILAS